VHYGSNRNIGQHSTDIPLVGVPATTPCHDCQLGQGTEFAYTIPTNKKVEYLLEAIHAGLSGPVEPFNIQKFTLWGSFDAEYPGGIFTFNRKKVSSI
jgi:hypothetical protein